MTYTPVKYGLMRSTERGSPAGMQSNSAFSARLGSPNTASLRYLSQMLSPRKRTWHGHKLCSSTQDTFGKAVRNIW